MSKDMYEELQNFKFTDVVSMDEALDIFGDEQVFMDNLKLFAESFHESFTTVHNDWVSQNISTCTASSHKFKGSCFYACCMPLIEAMKVYSLDCKKGNLDLANISYC